MTVSPPAPRWLRALAVLTVLAALPLVSLGAVVTTKKVGMVDPVGFRTPWHMLTVPLEEVGLGFAVEHSHRLAGWTVGFGSLILAVGLWLCEPRRWLCWLGTAAVLAVGVQGLLGGFRVQLHALVGPDLAMIHGIFGQLVFALLVSLALCLFGMRAREEMVEEPAEAAVLQRGTLALVGSLVLQLVVGAVLRHQGAGWSQRVHLLLAFAVLALVVWLEKAVWQSGRRLRRTGIILAGLLIFQIMLGVESWVFRVATDPYAPVADFWGRDLVRSAHVLVGALVLASAAALALQVQGQPTHSAGDRELEGAA